LTLVVTENGNNKALNMAAIMEFFSRQVDPDAEIRKREAMIDAFPTHEEECDCFFKDSEEIRAEPELGGLGPGLTGEHTLYSFVVCRNDKRWVIKKRFSHLHAFDTLLMNTIKDHGGDESKLPEFPEKQVFGKMSPSLVRERQTKIENYLKEISRDKDLTEEPCVRMFFKLPMNAEEAEQLEDDANAAADPGLLTGYGGYKSLYQRTREEKARGTHHTQKKEMFAGPPTLAGASEVGEAFSNSSVHDKKGAKTWVFRIPLVAQFGGQTVNDIFGDEVRGLHSTYNNQIKKQVERSMAEGKETKGKKPDEAKKEGN